MIQTKCRQIREAPHSRCSHTVTPITQVIGVETGSTSTQLLFPSGKELTFLASIGRKTWASQVGKWMATHPGGSEQAPLGLSPLFEQLGHLPPNRDTPGTAAAGQEG